MFHIVLICTVFLTSFVFPAVVRTDGKGSRSHVFSLVSNTSMRTGHVLDIAANTQEELKEWVFKIREVTMTSEAKVDTHTHTLCDAASRKRRLRFTNCSCHTLRSHGQS